MTIASGKPDFENSCYRGIGVEDNWVKSHWNTFPGLLYQPWQKLGLLAGFLGVNGCSKRWRQVECRKEFCQTVGTKTLYLLDQVHTAKVLELRDRQQLASFQEAAQNGFPYPEEYRADGVVTTIDLLRECAFGLRTADCAPVLLKRGQVVALVHAGWRGVAAGILEQAVKMLSKEDSSLEALVGPCAGSCCYEVGPEVWQALGLPVAAGAGKEKLDLGALVSSRLADLGGTVSNLKLCTICHQQFHSYRREGINYGSNLSFLG